MPVIVLSETAGLVIWSLAVNSIVALFMRGLGAMRCSFKIPVTLVAGLGMLLLILSLCIIALMALRIRRADPMTLMTDE